MNQKKAMLCVGIDSFQAGITPLLGAANDARKLGSIFELLLGFTVKVLTHEDLARGANIFRAAQTLLDGLGEGDVFGLFLATHGKAVPGQMERVFLLPDAMRSSLSSGRAWGTGLLPLSQLAEETARAGVSRFFIFDACRSPIEVGDEGPRDGEDSFVADTEAIDRDVAQRFQARTGTDRSPLVIVNSCADQQRAKELRSLQRGLFSLSAEEVLNDYVRAGRPVDIGNGLVSDIALAMQRKADAHSLGGKNQRPNVEGPALPIWRRNDAQATERQRLQAEFQRQLAASQLEEPWGHSARDSLAQLAASGLPAAEHETLAAALRDAMAAQRAQADRRHDAQLLEQAQADPGEASWYNVRFLARLPATRERAIDQIASLRAPAQAEQRAWAYLSAQAPQDEPALLLAIAAGQQFDAVHAHSARAAQARAMVQTWQEALARLQAAAQENSAWQAALQAPSEAQYAAFLAAWPAGAHAGEARESAKRLQAERERSELQARHDADWLAAEAAQTVPAYQHYQARWPQGAHRPAALRRVGQLQAASVNAAAAAAALAAKTAPPPVPGTDTSTRQGTAKVINTKVLTLPTKRSAGPVAVAAGVTLALAAAGGGAWWLSAQPQAVERPAMAPAPAPPGKVAAAVITPVPVAQPAPALADEQQAKPNAIKPKVQPEAAPTPARAASQTPTPAAASAASAASTVTAAPATDAAALARYRAAHQALRQSAWWTADDLRPASKTPAQAASTLAAAGPLADLGVPEALLDAGRAHALGRGLPLEPARGVALLARWLATTGAQPGYNLASADHKQAIEAVDEALATAIRQRQAGPAWGASLAALATIARHAPVDYWQGVVQRCLVSPPDLKAAQAALRRALTASSPHDGAEAHQALAQAHLQALGKPCGR